MTPVDPDPALSAGEVARRLGVAPTTVRTWDRRYGLGPARRETGRHRRYTGQDLARLALMRRLTAEGVAPAAAARIARETTDPERLSGGPADLPVPRRRRTTEVRGLGRAAIALDAPELDRLLSRAVAAGVVAAWTDLICPALRDIGRWHVTTGRFVESEHLLSTAVSVALAAVPRALGSGRILLACGPDEQHCLALEAVAAALAEQGVPSRMLGARVPARALRDAVTRTGPQAVMLWAHTPEAADTEALRAASAARPRPALVLACGPGWEHRPTPPGVLTPTDLPQALTLLTALP